MIRILVARDIKNPGFWEKNLACLLKFIQVHVSGLAAQLWYKGYIIILRITISRSVVKFWVLFKKICIVKELCNFVEVNQKQIMFFFFKINYKVDSKQIFSLSYFNHLF